MRSDILLDKRLAGLLVAAAAFAGAAPVEAQNFPTRPVKIISGFPAGGQTDILARLVAQTVKLGQPVVVETKLGGNGIVSLSLVAKAEPDGHTLVISNAGLLTIVNGISADLPYKPERDFAPVIVVGGGPIVLESTAKLPVKNVAELVALAKSKPGKLNYAGTTPATVPGLLTEQFRQKSGIEWNNISYKGSGTKFADLISGQVDFTFDNLAASIPYIKAGQFRALATSKKTALLPGVPTFKEAGYAIDDALAWHGILAPAATPAPVVAQLNAEIGKVLKQPEVVKKLQDIAIDVIGGTPAEFAGLIKSEHARWGKVVKEANITSID